MYIAVILNASEGSYTLVFKILH